MRRTSYTTTELVEVFQNFVLTHQMLADWVARGIVRGYSDSHRVLRIPVTELPVLRALLNGDPVSEAQEQRPKTSQQRVEEHDAAS